MFDPGASYRVPPEVVAECLARCENGFEASRLMEAIALGEYITAILLAPMPRPPRRRWWHRRRP